MNKGIANIWDGENFRQVPWDEAEQLEKEDKCQNLSAQLIGGNELKYRHQFKGYMTREMRAEPPMQPIQMSEEEAKNWKEYRTRAKKALKLDKVKKADVISWMKSEGLVDG